MINKIELELNENNHKPTIKVTTGVEVISERARLIFEHQDMIGYERKFPLKHDLNTVTENDIKNEVEHYTMEWLASRLQDVKYGVPNGVPRHIIIGNISILGFGDDGEAIYRGEIEKDKDFRIVIKEVEFYEYDIDEFTLEDIKRL